MNGMKKKENNKQVPGIYCMSFHKHPRFASFCLPVRVQTTRHATAVGAGRGSKYFFSQDSCHIPGSLAWGSFIPFAQKSIYFFEKKYVLAPHKQRNYLRTNYYNNNNGETCKYQVNDTATVLVGYFHISSIEHGVHSTQREIVGPQKTPYALYRP